jgi:hypothetical protein
MWVKPGFFRHAEILIAARRQNYSISPPRNSLAWTAIRLNPSETDPFFFPFLELEPQPGLKPNFTAVSLQAAEYFLIEGNSYAAVVTSRDRHANLQQAHVSEEERMTGIQAKFDSGQTPGCNLVVISSVANIENQKIVATFGWCYGLKVEPKGIRLIAERAGRPEELDNNYLLAVDRVEELVLGNTEGKDDGREAATLILAHQGSGSTSGQARFLRRFPTHIDR